MVLVWVNMRPIRDMTSYMAFPQMFGQDAVHLIGLQQLTWITANWIDGIIDTPPLIAPQVGRQER